MVNFSTYDNYLFSFYNMIHLSTQLPNTHLKSPIQFLYLLCLHPISNFILVFMFAERIMGYCYKENVHLPSVLQKVWVNVLQFNQLIDIHYLGLLVYEVRSLTLRYYFFGGGTYTHDKHVHNSQLSLLMRHQQRKKQENYNTLDKFSFTVRYKNKISNNAKFHCCYFLDIAGKIKDGQLTFSSAMGIKNKCPN